MLCSLVLAIGMEFQESPRPEPQKIRVGAYVINVGKFDLASGSYTMDFYLTFESDRELPAGYNTEKPSDLAFEFMNGRASHVERIESAPTKAVYRILANLFVPIDLRRYPFDRQVLTLQIEDKRRKESEVRYAASPKDTGVDGEVVIIGWDLQRTETLLRNHDYPDGEVFHQYKLNLHLRRSGITSTLKVFVPLVCFLVVSFITLMLTPESYDKRLGTNTGMLIASVMFHVAVISSIPPLGYLTLADRLVMATYITIGYHVLQCVRMMRHWMKEEKDEAQRIHATCRWGVPLIAVLSYPSAVLSAFLL